MVYTPPGRPRAVRGPARLLRGWSAAVIATVLAAGSHTLAHTAGPGHAAHDAGPAPIVWTLTLALAGPLCTALAGRRLSWWRLAAGVGTSQVLFHWLFSVSAVPGAPSAGPAGHPMHSGHGIPAGQGMVLPGGLVPTLDASTLDAPILDTLPGAEPASALGHLSPAMLAAHMLAAVATVLLLRRGERLAARVGDLAVGLILRSPGAALARWVPAVPPRRVRVRSHRPRRRSEEALLPILRRRGPPEFALAA